VFSVDDALIVKANQEFWLIDDYTTLRQENFRNMKKYAVSEHFTLFDQLSSLSEKCGEKCSEQ